MAVIEEPILSKLDRLDNKLRQLEEIRGGNRSPKSSSASTPSLASEGHCSSLDLSPKSTENHCLPINRVMVDIEVKGTLVQRIDQLDQRLLKLEGETEAERKREEKNGKKKKGLKGLVNKMKGNKKNHQTENY